MRNGWILTIAFFILAGGLAFADTTVSITSSPFVLNPAVTTNLSINFTLTNPTFFSGTDTYDIRFYISDNATFEQGTDTEIAGSNTTFAALTCGGDILTSGATCSHTFPIGAQTDGSKYIVLVATLNAITPAQASQSILFDSVAPSASITSPANAAVVATLLPTFTITGNPGSGSNLTIGSFTINGHAHVLTFVSNVATITADPTDGMVVGQTYTASVDTVVDAAGNANNTPSSITFSISSTAPANVAATSGASNTYTNDKTPSISITAEDTISAGGLVALIKCDGASSFVEKTMSGNSVSLDDFDVTTSPSCTTSDGQRTLKVAVKNALGNTSTTVDLIIKYDGTKPGIPANVGSENVNTDNATITWSAAGDATSGIDNYRVYRSTTNSFSSAADVGSTSSLSKQVTGLSACTTYYFWVKSRDVAGNESDAQSSPLSFTTSGCSSGGSGGSGSGSGSGGSGSGGGGSGASSCEVTFSIPTSLYEGDSVAVKVSGKTYANGHFRVTPTGFPTQTIEKSGLAQNSWGGNYTVPKAGLTLKFVFGTDSCTASTSRTVSPKSSKPAAAPPAAKQTNDEEDADDESDTPSATLNEPAPVISLGTTTLSFSMDKVSELMAFAGFNAENAEQRSKIESLITDTGLAEIIHVIPGVGEGNYQIEIVLTLVNRSNAGTLKVVQQVPKSFAETAGLIESNYPMTILKDDPLVQFEISDLSEGQTVEIRLKSKEQYSLTEANAKVQSLQGESTPPLMFASGTAKPAEGGGLASISGLVGAVGSSAPFVLGFVLVLGLIFVSIRVVRGSVEGSDNPILRSASRIGERNGSSRIPTANGTKRWKKDKMDDAA